MMQQINLTGPYFGSYVSSERVKYLLLNYKQCCSYQKYSKCHPSAPKTQSCDKTAKSYITLSKTLIRILSDTFEILTPRFKGLE